MKIKLKPIIIGLLILGTINLNAQEKIIKSEAKYYCQCYKSFYKEKKKIEKKAKRKEKRDAKGRKYKPGMKPFGGYSLTLNLKDCLDKKRTKKTTRYIESLNEQEKEKFEKKVKNRLKKKCPKKYLKYN